MQPAAQPSRNRLPIACSVLRDEYARRLAMGERLTLKAFAKEKGVGFDSLRRKAAAARWIEHSHVIREELSRRAWDELEIDQIQVRKAQLASFQVAAKLLHDEVRYFADAAERRRRGPIEGEPEATGGPALSIKDLRALQQMVSELAIVGAGLPKVHSVTVEDHRDEVVWNRDEMRQAEAKGRELREYAQARGIGPYRVINGGKR